jgi:hypothetical protein
MFVVFENVNFGAIEASEIFTLFAIEKFLV